MPATANEPPTAHLITMQTALARALSVEDIDQLGRDTCESWFGAPLDQIRLPDPPE